MKYTQLFGKASKNPPSDADSANARLLVQAGFVDRLAAGIYNYLPLGMRVLHKINQIIREEMNKIGGQEILMPVLHPRELWQKTGRDSTMDGILYRTEGVKGHEFVLSPSHEETVVLLGSHFIQSYKDLPVAVYQIQTKFRNEPRAKSGVLRGREFGMKDMYSYHSSEEDLEEFYQKSIKAYFNVFNRCGLEAYIIEASGGAFSDKHSHEFAVKTDAGEDTMLLCEKCKFAQNYEIAQSQYDSDDEEEKPLLKKHTQREADIEASAKAHKVHSKKVLKSVVYKVGEGFMGVCIRGDLQVQTQRLEKYLKEKLRVATSDELKAIGLVPGFISPIGSKIPFIADHSIKYVKNFATGSNELYEDYVNANLGRDFTIKEFLHLADLPLVCPKCKSSLAEHKVIEAGNIFKLGDKYCRDLNVTFTDKDGKKNFPTMGCYGIGTTRLVGTIVEASHDDKGIIWPASVAPFSVHLLSLGKDQTVKDEAESIYAELISKGIEVLYDDRDESIGKKLNDADLIGIPLRAVISEKSIKAGGIEIKRRNEEKTQIVNRSELLKL